MVVVRCIARLLVFFYAFGGFAADVQTFTISQAYPQLPVLTAYLDIVDAGGQPVAGLTPADFAAVLGRDNAQVVDFKSFQSTGEGVAYIFLVDISKSIASAQFTEMQEAIKAWIAGLKPVDRGAICTFGEDYQLLTDFTSDKARLTAALDSLAPHDLHTRLYLAITRAVELEQRVDPGLPNRRAMVVLSDGKDEGSALTPDDVLLKVRSSHLPIYTIGVSRLKGADRARYLDVLHRFSNVSGGLYEEATAQSVSQLYSAIEQAILRVFEAHLSCPQCQADGRSCPLEITLRQGSRGLKADPLDLVLLPGPPPAPHAPSLPPVRQKIPLWTYLVAGLMAVVVAGFAIRRRTPVSPPPPDQDAAVPHQAATADTTVQEIPPSVPEPVSPAGIALTFWVVIGRDAGAAYKLNLQNKAVIGRAGDCALVVNDPRASNHHCELVLAHGRVLISDLSSTNSTCVNGVPILSRHRLEPQDIIQVGDTKLRVNFEES